jgi:C4-dicarboxylate transporter/malic acid transport protein
MAIRERGTARGLPVPRPALRPLSLLDHPSIALRNLGPNWFAMVMGTGIVATAGATLPLQFGALRAFATAVWGLASLLLVLLSTAIVVEWLRTPRILVSQALDPFMAHFFGAPAMALLTVGSGTLLLGPPLLGTFFAVHADWVLWCLGTATGIVSTLAVPYLMFTTHELTLDDASGHWMMPIVPPMVSAAAGALLMPYAPAGQARLDLLVGCYALFGVSAMASFAVLVTVWQKLALRGVGTAAARVPLLWILLGPLGQSVTAAVNLGGAASTVVPAPVDAVLRFAGGLYGVPVLGFAVVWLLIVATITARTARAGLPFALTWWSFTFPVGTMVTGATALFLLTGSSLFQGVAVALYVFLVLAWAVTLSRTLTGALTGRLFLPAPPAVTRATPEPRPGSR